MNDFEKDQEFLRKVSDAEFKNGFLNGVWEQFTAMKNQYQLGYHQALKDVMEKVIKPNDVDTCILYDLDWKDVGCACNCLECIEEHYKHIIENPNFDKEK